MVTASTLVAARARGEGALTAKVPAEEPMG